MSSIEWLLEGEETPAAVDLVIGGDGSEQGSNDTAVACYAMSALSVAEIANLDATVGRVLERHLGVGASSAELHAKQIWNGSERRKSSFHALSTKNQMKEFLIDLCTQIGRCGLQIVVAVIHISSLSHDCFRMQHESEMSIQRRIKRSLVYASLSRLDLNVHILTGRHLGQRHVLLDSGDKMPAGFVRELVVGNISHGKIGFRSRIDPTYSDHDSRSHRLIQVSDLAAYIVGKQLVLNTMISRELNNQRDLTTSLYRSIEDCNFLLLLWELLNLESILHVDIKQVSKLPSSMRAITSPYQAILNSLGMWTCSCSIREAVTRNVGDRPKLNGVGYWTLILENQET